MSRRAHNAARSHPGQRSLRRRRAVHALLASSILLGAAACGDSDDAASTATTTAQEATATSAESTTSTASAATSDDDARCQARDDLRAALQALQDVNIIQGGTDALDAGIADVRSALDEIEAAAGDDLEGEVTAVRSSLDDLSTAVEGLPQQESGSQAIASVTSALTEVAESVGALTTELQQDCG